MEVSSRSPLRAFLENDWVAGFHDVEGEGDLVIPEQVLSGQSIKVRSNRREGSRLLKSLRQSQ